MKTEFGTDGTLRIPTPQELRRSVYARERIDFRGFSVQPGERMTIAEDQNGVGAFELRVIDSGGARLVVELDHVEVR